MTTTSCNINNPSQRLVSYIDTLDKEKQLLFDFDNRYIKIPSLNDNLAFYTSFQEEINSKIFTIEKAIYAYLLAYKI